VPAMSSFRLYSFGLIPEGPSVILFRQMAHKKDSPTLQSFPFENMSDIPFAVQNLNHPDRVTAHKVINGDCLESVDRPEPQVLKLRVAQGTEWARKGMLAERFTRMASRKRTATCGTLRVNKIIPELEHDIVTGGLTVGNLHEFRSNRRSASIPSVRLFTVSQNSPSVSSLEANPSASGSSISSSVP
jgi:hypothetical protein